MAQTAGAAAMSDNEQRARAWAQLALDSFGGCLAYLSAPEVAHVRTALGHHVLLLVQAKGEMDATLVDAADAGGGGAFPRERDVAFVAIGKASDLLRTHAADVPEPPREAGVSDAMELQRRDEKPPR